MGRVRRSAVGTVAAAAASLVVEVNTNHCAVPGDQLELPGAPRQRKTGENKIKQMKQKNRCKRKTAVLLSKSL